MAALLELRNLTLDIPTDSGLLRPVRGVDLSLARGETLAIVGESGCGKSLTALAVMGLLPPHARLSADRLALSGQSLLGLDARQWRAVRGRRIAMIFQDPMTAFDPCFRIGAQIAEVLRQHRPEAATPQRMAAMFERVGIASPRERLQQYPHELSGGLRQRAMIALALLCEPELLIADEPTTALDATIQAQILHLLADLQQEAGISLLLITHDLGVVAGIADRVLVMYAGEVVETGSTDQVLASPRHPYAEGLMRSIPTRSADGRRAALGFIAGTVPRPVAERAGCGFFPRCPYAQPACRIDAVALRAGADDRAVRCVLPLDGSGRTPEVWTRPRAAAHGRLLQGAGG